MSIKFLISLLGLSLIIGLHEFGHYLFARMCNVGVEIFSIGMGPVIWSRTDSRGTKWQICAIPIGGYVYPKEHSEISGLKYKEAGAIRGSLVALAGPLFNFITAILCLAGVSIFFGTPKFSNEIESIEKDSYAYSAKIQNGDKILSINDKKIISIQDLATKTETSKLTIERNGEKMEVQIKKPISAPFGINMKNEYGEKVPVLSAFKNATLDVAKSIQIFFTKIWGAIISLKIMGPIGIIKSASTAQDNGWINFVLFLSAISIAIGATNLLPIPILDGGRIIMFLISGIIRRPVPEKIEKFLNYSSVIIIAAIFAIGFFTDIKGLM